MNRTTDPNPKPSVLACDPSMRAWGWVVLTPEGIVLDSGCIETLPNTNKTNIRKGDDRIRRISELNVQLLSIIDEHNVRLVVSEQPHGSQSASAAVMIGITAGIMQTICDCFSIPIEWYTEGDAKKAIADKRSVAKDEMIEIAGGLYSLDWHKTKEKNRAVADALAVHYVAMQQSQMIKMMISI